MYTWQFYDHPYLVSLLFAVLLSLHLVTFLMFFITCIYINYRGSPTHSTAQSVHTHKQCTSLHSYAGWKTRYRSNVFAACYCSILVASCLMSLLYSERSFCQCLIKLSFLNVTVCSITTAIIHSERSLVPKLERSARYPLFVHVRLPRFFWGTWKLWRMCSCMHKQWIPGTPLRFFSSAWERGYSSLTTYTCALPHFNPIVKLNVILG